MNVLFSNIQKPHNNITFNGKPPNKKLFEPIADEFVKSFEKIRQEEKQFHLSSFPEKTREIASKFYDIPEYDFYHLPYLKEKKKDELQYLYNIATKRDVYGDLRIPSEALGYCSQIPKENLKAIRSLALHKNFFGGWTFPPEIFKDVNQLNEKQIKNMTTLLEHKINITNVLEIMHEPEPIIDKITEKTKNLNILFGDKLQEIEFGINKNGERYLSADIHLPHEVPNINHDPTFKRVFSLLDDNINPVIKNSSKQIENHVENINKSLENKLHIFSEKELDTAIQNIQKDMPDIKEIEILSIMQRLTQFSNYSSLEGISKELLAENIGSIKTNEGLNSFFNYFAHSKELFPLSKKESAKNAILVTKNDIKTLTKTTNPNENIYINLEGWTDGINLFTDDKKLEQKTREVLQKAKIIQQRQPDLTLDDAVSQVLNAKIEKVANQEGIEIKTIRIDAPPTKDAVLNQMKPIMPTKNLIKSTIETVAGCFSTSEKEYSNLCDDIAKYYEQNLNVYSKQSIIENLKTLNNKINTYLKENNLPKENLYYIMDANPWKQTSFELINKMNQELFNIPEDKIAKLTTIRRINEYLPNSTFVILDDVLGSGDSMMKKADYMFLANKVDKDKHVIFAPITANESGIEYLNNFINIIKRHNVDTIIPVNTQKPINLNSSSELFNVTIGDKGHQQQCMSTVFPYMAPDNNSALSSYIANFFVPDYHCIKTKPDKLPEIEEKIYYYNIFGTDKDHLLTDAGRVYSPKTENTLIKKLKSFFVTK